MNTPSHLNRLMMNPSIKRTEKVIAFIFDALITKPATILMLVFMMLLIDVGGLQSWIELIVHNAAEHAWMGVAPEGYINLYCADNSEIQRQIPADPCPNSEVVAITFSDSASYTTRWLIELYLYALLGGLLMKLFDYFWPNKTTQAT